MENQTRDQRRKELSHTGRERQRERALMHRSLHAQSYGALADPKGSGSLTKTSGIESPAL